jgi:hypothetical protein
METSFCRSLGISRESSVIFLSQPLSAVLSEPGLSAPGFVVYSQGGSETGGGRKKKLKNFRKIILKKLVYGLIGVAKQPHWGLIFRKGFTL